MFPLGSRVHLISRSSGLPWCFLPVRGAPRLTHPHGPDTDGRAGVPHPGPIPAVIELRHPVPRTCPIGHPRHHHPSSPRRCPWPGPSRPSSQGRAVGPACSSQPVIPRGYGCRLAFCSLGGRAEKGSSLGLLLALFTGTTCSVWLLWGGRMVVVIVLKRKNRVVLDTLGRQDSRARWPWCSPGTRVFQPHSSDWWSR